MRGPLCVVAVALLAAACSPEVVRQRIVAPSAAGARGHADSIVLAQAALLRLGTGYERVLGAGSRWRFAGVIPQGGVYRAAQGVLTVEGANIHEAYLVIRERRVVGFYLPVEQAFSPLGEAVPLSIGEN
jgi:hypothetical protein